MRPKHWLQTVTVLSDNNGSIYRSTDGTTFNKVSSDKVGHGPKIYFVGSDVWSIVGSNGIWRSADNGATWSQVLNKTLDTKTELITDGTTWLVASVDSIWYSTNSGVSWTVANSDFMPGPDRLVFKVFSVYNIVTPEGIWSSTNGISWTKTTTEPIGSKLSYTSTTGKVVIVSSRGTWYSTDGTNWALFELSSPEAVLFANGIWIAAGKSGIYRSINGISWMPVSGTNIPLYYNDYNNEIFIIMFLETTGLLLQNAVFGTHPTMVQVGRL